MVTITIESPPSIPGLKIINIKGSIDSVTHKQVDKKILPLIEQHSSNIIIDLSTVHYLSSIGMMCFINYVKIMTEKERVLKFVKPPNHVYNSMQVAGLADKFHMYDSVEAAMRSLS